MDTRRGRVATFAGAAVVGLGSVAWALAATSMTAVHAAEARALGPGHTSELPGEDELALVAHDARLASMIAVACGLAVIGAALPGRSGVAEWLGGVAALVVANATLGRLVDDGSVLLAAIGLVLLVGAASAVAGRKARRRRAPEAHTGGAWSLVMVSGVLAAGTLPVLGAQGMWSERYVDWLPADLVTSHLVTALTLGLAAVAAAVLLARSAVDVVLGVALPVTALVLLVEPSGSSWQVREEGWVAAVVLGLVSAPLLLAAAGGGARSRRRRAVTGAVLLASGGVLAGSPQLLAPPVIVGGMLGLVLTGPAGAYVNYDGLPVVGGGVLVAVALFTLHLLIRDQAGPSTASPEVLGATRH